VFGAGVAVQLLATIRQEHEKEVTDELREKLKESDQNVVALQRSRKEQRSAASGCLDEASRVLAELVSLPVDGRLSVYRRLDTGWHRMARHCENLEWRSSGRRVLPLEEGLLHRAYQRGSAAASGLPDSRTDPRAYADEQRQLGVPRSALANQRMRSRSYALSAFPRPGGVDRLYVVVIESTDPQGVTLPTLQTTLSAQLQQMLGTLVDLALAGDQ
jgi:hypothetical protein